MICGARPATGFSEGPSLNVELMSNSKHILLLAGSVAQAIPLIVAHSPCDFRAIFAYFLVIRIVIIFTGGSWAY